MNSDSMRDTKLDKDSESKIEGVRISIKRNFDGI